MTGRARGAWISYEQRKGGKETGMTGYEERIQLLREMLGDEEAARVAASEQEMMHPLGDGVRRDLAAFERAQEKGRRRKMERELAGRWSGMPPDEAAVAARGGYVPEEGTRWEHFATGHGDGNRPQNKFRELPPPDYGEVLALLTEKLRKMERELAVKGSRPMRVTWPDGRRLVFPTTLTAAQMLRVARPVRKELLERNYRMGGFVFELGTAAARSHEQELERHAGEMRRLAKAGWGLDAIAKYFCARRSVVRGVMERHGIDWPRKGRGYKKRKRAWEAGNAGDSRERGKS